MPFVISNTGTWSDTTLAFTTTVLRYLISKFCRYAVSDGELCPGRGTIQRTTGGTGRMSLYDSQPILNHTPAAFELNQEMTASHHRRRFLVISLSAIASSSISGCGAILHPERRGQGRASGEIDWRVAGLDAAGLLLFFVPGVVAFAVDFHQGTIFLPSNGMAGPGQEPEKLVAITFPGQRLSRQLIEETVASHTEKRVDLTPGFYQATKLEHLAEFWNSRDRLMQG